MADTHRPDELDRPEHRDTRCPVCGQGELQDIGYVRPRDGAPLQRPESREILSFSCGHEVQTDRLESADQHALSVERRRSEDTVTPPRANGVGSGS